MHGDRFRLGYVVSHPIQYQAPLLRRLAAVPELSLHVIFLSDFSAGQYVDPGFGTAVKWDIPLLEGYDYEVLAHGDQSPSGGFRWPEAKGMVRAIRRNRFDAVWFHGYSRQALLEGIIWCRLSRTPYFIRSDVWRLTAKRPRLIGRAKERLVASIVRGASACLYVGVHNKQYYESLGVRPDRLHFVPYAVDNAFFEGVAREVRGAVDDYLRRYGLSRDKVKVLFASKLMRIKRVLDLFEACAAIWRDRPQERLELVVVGTGEDEAELRRRIAERGFEDRVKLLGFLEQRQMAEVMGLCDVFVLPGEHEAWGLVVNEAMAAGLPVIVTEEVGCAPDLVHVGENGFVIPVGDISALRGALETLLGDPALVSRMSKRSREIVAAYSYDADVEGVLQAWRSARGSTGP